MGKWWSRGSRLGHGRETGYGQNWSDLVSSRSSASSVPAERNNGMRVWHCSNAIAAFKQYHGVRYPPAEAHDKTESLPWLQGENCCHLHNLSDFGTLKSVKWSKVRVLGITLFWCSDLVEASKEVRLWKEALVYRRDEETGPSLVLSLYEI